MDGFVHGCGLCGYRYHEELGDPERQIPPGTRFEELPAAWTCPRCGAAHDEFMLVPRPP
jgi:rubredoxin